MSGVGDGLVTVKLASSSDVVIEHPVLGPHTLRTTGVTFLRLTLLHLAELQVFVVTGNALCQIQSIPEILLEFTQRRHNLKMFMSLFWFCVGDS